MKRSGQGIETPINTEEPRLEVEESATSLSSAAQEGLEGHNNSSLDKSASVRKEILTMKPKAPTRPNITAGRIEGIFTEENYGRG